MKKIVVFFFSSFLLTVQAVQSAGNDVEIIRKRVVAEMLISGINNEQIRKLVDSINPDGTWPGINYTDTSKTGFQHSRHLDNLVQLSKAYVKNESSFRGDKKVKNTIDLALDYWTANDFICENWWNNEIGTPNALIQVLLMMDKNLTEKQVSKTLPIVKRSHLGAWGARESGDRIKIGGIQAKTALYYRDIQEFEYVIKVIEGQIRFVTGRGMQYDYSFHHRDDRVNNTLSYGLDYADAFAEWVYYTTGTKYRFSEKPLQQLIDYYLDGICKMMPYGKYPDPGATNRDISRPGSLRVFRTTTPERLIAVTDYRKSELEQIIRNRKGIELKSPPYGRFFRNSEYYTHQRDGYFTSVRMFSSRNANMEVPYNGEGLLNHHRGDGTNYISRTGREYINTAPVFDWQKIPGATILQKPELIPEKNIQKYGSMDFVGAVTNGLYGAVAFDFKSPHDPVEVRKAWFFFDEEYVCLGAGIRSESEYPVATTLNQCLLNGDVIVMNDNREQILSKGEHRFESVKWIFHDSIGYFFPVSSPVSLSNKVASGTWFKINRQTTSSREEIRLDMFKLWLNHGSRISDRGYQYVVIPAATKEKVSEYAVNPKIEILFNTPDIQAVWHKELNIGQVVFYQRGEVRLPGDLRVKMDSPGILMIKLKENGIEEISVSDPSRKMSEFHFSLNRKIEKEDEYFQSKWNDADNRSEISVNLPQTVYAGQSVTIRLFN